MSVSLSEISNQNDKWLEMAVKLTKDVQQAKDLLQDTYLFIHRRLEKSDLPPLNEVTSGYMAQALKFNFYSDKRKKQYEFFSENMEIYEDMEDSQEVLENRKMVADALDEIPYLEREILLQHQEKSQRQLQKETGVCRDRLRLHKNRGMQKLQKILKEKYGNK